MGKETLVDSSCWNFERIYRYNSIINPRSQCFIILNMVLKFYSLVPTLISLKKLLNQQEIKTNLLC